MRAIDKYKSGDFNNTSWQWQPDGSVIITLSSSNEPEVYKFRVKNLDQENEEELDVSTGEPISKGDLPASLPKMPEETRKGSKRKGR